MDDRALLLQLMAGPASGDSLARHAGQTRAAVWKRIEALRAAGVPIEARPGRGYALGTPLDLLDAGQITAALPANVQSGVATLEVAWSLESTNTELLARPAPAHGVAVLLAERQTGGRGRRGRPWVSPLAAHLYLSLARSFSGGLARLGGLSLVAGIAAAEALRGCGYGGVGLKWPNDLVVSHPGGLRKLGGLLIEGGGEHAGPVRAVIGLGVNVRMPAAAAASVDQPWIDLTGLGGATDRNRLAAALLAALLPALDEFDAEGLAPFLPRYEVLDVLAGQPVWVQAGNALLAGRAVGLDADGALRVQLVGGGERSFHAGEVSVRGGRDA